MGVGTGTEMLSFILIPSTSSRSAIHNARMLLMRVSQVLLGPALMRLLEPLQRRRTRGEPRRDPAMHTMLRGESSLRRSQSRASSLRTLERRPEVRTLRLVAT